MPREVRKYDLKQHLLYVSSPNTRRHSRKQVRRMCRHFRKIHRELLLKYSDTDFTPYSGYRHLQMVS